jgi:hypothetical protein
MSIDIPYSKGMRIDMETGGGEVRGEKNESHETVKQDKN